MMILQKLNTDKIEIAQKIKQKQEFKLLGSMILKPGLILWEFDFNKMEIKEADIDINRLISFQTQKPTENKKVYSNPNAYYFQTHNQRTAIKKANKIVFDESGVKDYFQLKDGKILRKVLK